MHMNSPRTADAAAFVQVTTPRLLWLFAYLLLALGYVLLAVAGLLALWLWQVTPAQLSASAQTLLRTGPVQLYALAGGTLFGAIGWFWKGQRWLSQWLYGRLARYAVKDL
jgi:hypothetical protein